MTQKAHINKEQDIAASPKHSCWLMASAGTGKTKVLIDRVLRLLLEKNHPSSILCLTYTNAAAKEMLERLFLTLKDWAFLSHDQLKTTLESMTKEPVDDALLSHAQNLFNLVQYSPPAIQTIHSFCQKILTQCPFEADLSPGFKLLDDMMAEILRKEAAQKSLQDSENIEFLRCLAPFIHENYLTELLEDALSQRLRLSQYTDPEKKLKERLNFSPAPALSDKEREEIYSLAKHVMEKGPKNLHEKAVKVIETHRVQAKPQENSLLFDFFLTQDGFIRKKFSLSQDMSREEALQDFATRILSLRENDLAQEVLSINTHLFKLIEKTIQHYQDVKFKQNTLDFDDLLEKTLQLFQSSSGWILKHLDHRFDHILVDEAQDTSVVQWKIILYLLDHFFDSFGENGHIRTLFVVGDAKQSIYSFQGANPHFYLQVLGHIKDLCAQNRHPLEVISLSTCYRQSPKILEFVDKVFAHPDTGLHLLTQDISHIPFRKHHLGGVFTLPLTTKEREEERENWTLPTMSTKSIHQSHAHILCDLIQHMYETHLESQERPATFDDMMILFQRRGTLMKEVFDILSERGIPSSSSHDASLLESLPIMDLMSALAFLNDPHDDYNLACLLKSPLFNMDESTLQTMCKNREISLWSHITSHKTYETYTLPLHTFLEVKKASNSAFDLCYRAVSLLSKPMAAHFGDRIYALYESFLGLAHTMFLEGVTTLQDFLNKLPDYGKKVKNPHTIGVKLMTVHGSKGLEAPIVILADAGSKALCGQGYFVFSKAFYFFRSTHSTLKVLKSLEKEEEFSESKRLLYVALTRAKDQLILTGENPTFEESWYTVCKDYTEEMTLPTRKNHPNLLKKSSSLSVISTPLTFPPKKSPSSTQSKESLRGDIIHKLMERRFWSLPQQTQNQLKKDFPDIESGIWDHIKNIPESPIIGQYFKKNFMSEVEILSPERRVLRLDYLCIEEDDMTIIDYKTTPHTPSCSKEIEKSIQHQLLEYQSILSTLYPEKRVRAFVLYLHNLSFFEVENPEHHLLYNTRKN